MNKNTVKRSCTAGIPDFVPRKSMVGTTHHRQAKSNYYVPDIQEKALPPVTPCFSQADIDEFLARKPEKYKMTERDYKELGRNTLLGIGSILEGLVTATVICAPVVAGMMNTENKSDSESEYRYGSDGTIYKGNAVIFDIENY
ncbi:hypothetical protein J4198_004836 [Salmonella enterica]|nr:hypothetical protein [Salmonella enterica]EDM8864314.1 hypothetical protein [Salmonella enterica subsp. enterica serovar Typhimurium]EIN6983796.1 hypothetical protein [Salmonella enterica subsp. enterica serovar Enteritidis]ECK3229495.1 hypothetical protein [Salmonella enterica]ECL5068346.1 hypothetical protein [Salmonella enterica]